MIPVRGIETWELPPMQPFLKTFKLMIPVRGIETTGFSPQLSTVLGFQINDSRSRD